VPQHLRKSQSVLGQFLANFGIVALSPNALMPH